MKEKVRVIEDQIAKEVADANGRFMGQRRVREQDWRDSPTTAVEESDVATAVEESDVPPVVAGSEENRKQALLRITNFQKAYRLAFSRLKARLTPFEFPLGTYKLVRIGAVPVPTG